MPKRMTIHNHFRPVLKRVGLIMCLLLSLFNFGISLFNFLYNLSDYLVMCLASVFSVVFIHWLNLMSFFFLKIGWSHLQFSFNFFWFWLTIHLQSQLFMCLLVFQFFFFSFLAIFFFLWIAHEFCVFKSFFIKVRNN